MRASSGKATCTHRLVCDLKASPIASEPNLDAHRTPSPAQKSAVPSTYLWNCVISAEPISSGARALPHDAQPCLLLDASPSSVRAHHVYERLCRLSGEGNIRAARDTVCPAAATCFSHHLRLRRSGGLRKHVLTVPKSSCDSRIYVQRADQHKRGKAVCDHAPLDHRPSSHQSPLMSWRRPAHVSPVVHAASHWNSTSPGYLTTALQNSL